MYFAFLVGPTAGVLVLRVMFRMSVDASAETLSHFGFMGMLFGIGMLWAVGFYAALAWFAICLTLPPTVMWSSLRKNAKSDHPLRGRSEKQWVIWWALGCGIGVAVALALTRDLWMQA